MGEVVGALVGLMEVETTVGHRAEEEMDVGRMVVEVMVESMVAALRVAGVREAA